MKFVFVVVFTLFLVQCSFKKEVNFDLLEKCISENNFTEFEKLYDEIELDTFVNDENQHLLFRAIILNKPQFVEYLLKTNKLPIDVLDKNGRSPFHYAVNAVDQKSAFLLLHHIDLSNDSIYNDIVYQAFLKRHTSIRVIEKILEYRDEGKNDEYGPVYSSIIFCQCDKLRLLVDKDYIIQKEYGNEGNMYEVAQKYNCGCLKKQENS